MFGEDQMASNALRDIQRTAAGRTKNVDLKIAEGILHKEASCVHSATTKDPGLVSPTDNP